jgi:hypothetical protein
MTARFLLVLVALALLPAGAQTLDFYVVDVGQGNATLVVSPSGRTVLLDAGPRRTADRVVAVLKQAGITKLDYVVTSHFHEDHFGGVAPVAEAFPVGTFVDHGPSVELGHGEEWWRTLKGDQYRPGMGKVYEENMAEYTQAIRKGKHAVLKPGGTIDFQGADVLAVCSGGKTISQPLPGEGRPNAACTGIEARLDDYEEDGQSIGLLFTLGKFRFIQLGDLTWNLANGFFCPRNPVGTVDAYVITHHARSYPRSAGEMSWSLSSCPKAEVHGLRPRVAIGSLGAGAPVRRADALETVRTSPGLEDLWQTNLVRNGPEKEFNAEERFIANLGTGNQRPAFIKVSARADGSFSVTNSRNGFTKQYTPRAQDGPRLFVSGGDIERIRSLAASAPWAAKVRDGIIARADEWPASHVREFGLREWALPTEGAGWSHAYVCPEHGARLRQKAGQNLCPVDGKDYHGWPWDNVVYMQRHDDTARATRDLGLAWKLTGKAEYAAKARPIFNAYAALYPTLPVHDNNNRVDGRSGARIMSQTLSEANWLLPLVFGYDLVRESMTAEERARFETDVLRNAARVIARYQAGKSNWQSWHNAALLAVGLAVGDRELVTLALDGPGGFKFQTRESITPDGPWYEGAWGYHFYSLAALLETRELAVRAGIALPEAAALKGLLDAPIRCLFPDGTLPNFGDSGLTRLSRSARLYDIGYRIFGDRRYLAVIDAGERDLDSLLWGAGKLAAGQAAPLASELLANFGQATLRARDSDHTLAIKFGPPGSGHDHFDKLSFLSFANGAHLAADPGTQAYAAATHRTWDLMTVAHNTVVVDERSQARAAGRLLEWKTEPEASAIRVSAGPVYEGVELERTLVHTAGYTLDVFDARATDSKPHRFDWMYHNFGVVQCRLALAPYTLPKDNGYQHLTESAAAATAEPWEITFTQVGANLRVHMLGAPGTNVVVGKGLGPDLRVPVPFVMARREAASTRFAALYEPTRDKPRIRAFRQTAPGTYVVEIDGATDEITVTPGKLARKVLP